MNIIKSQWQINKVNNLIFNSLVYALHPDYVDTRHIIQLWAYVVTEYHYLTMNTEYVE